VNDRPSEGITDVASGSLQFLNAWSHDGSRKSGIGEVFYMSAHSGFCCAFQLRFSRLLLLHRVRVDILKSNHVKIGKMK